jgi:hypothetical protein
MYPQIESNPIQGRKWDVLDLVKVIPQGQVWMFLDLVKAIPQWQEEVEATIRTIVRS